MKRIIPILLIFILISGLTVTASAAPIEQMEVIEFGEGYATITTQVDATSRSISSSTRRASKVFRAYNSLGRLVWTYTLTGVFEYDGYLAEATNAYDSYSISNAAWSFDYSDTYCSGDTAYGEATFSSSIEDLSCSLSITCSPDGDIS